jgi:hypothetical protein
VFRDSAGINEGLRNDSQDGVHIAWHPHIKDELWILQGVHPEPQQQAGNSSWVQG